MASRRLASLACCALLVSAGALSQTLADQVTVYLTNGDSVGGNRASASPAALTLGSGTKRRTFEPGTVAMIAWLTGVPPADELKALPGEGHVVVLRNGTSQPGRLQQLGPDSLRWITTRGLTEEIRIADVARVYLNPGRARALFGTTSSGSPGPDRWGTKKTGEISVPGNQAWTDTGLGVRAGDRITFSASGQIRLSANRTHIAGPGGTGAIRSPNYPVPTAPAGALVARAGDGTPFLIGLGRQPLDMPNAGRLYLGINDDDTRDNSGSFEVTIGRQY